MDEFDIQSRSAAGSKEQVFAVLIALLKDNLLLPNLAISEVVARDALRVVEGAPPWFAGTVTTQGQEVPVLRFEILNTGEVDPPGRRTRIAIINCVSRNLAAGRFGVVCEGYPLLVTLNRLAMRPVAFREKDTPHLALTRVRVASAEALIPHLAHIEAALAEAVASLPVPSPG